MVVKFADGIEILVDDDKLLSWKQDKKCVMLWVKKEGTDYANYYEIDLEKKEIRRQNEQVR